MRPRSRALASIDTRSASAGGRFVRSAGSAARSYHSDEASFCFAGSERRIAFHDFDPQKIARYGKRDFERLMKNEGIIRSNAKIKAASVASMSVDNFKLGNVILVGPAVVC